MLHDLEQRLLQLETLIGGISRAMTNIARSEFQKSIKPIEQSLNQSGIYTALCVETIDIWKQNRVRFFSPLFHDPNQPIKSLPWAWPVSAFGGFDDCGVTWVPPAGSTLCIVFEGGQRHAPYYIGTAWSRDRGPAGNHSWGINIPEYYAVSDTHRKGYLCGPNDESQVLPPWNTENYNGFDINSVSDFDNNPEAQKRITYPNIFGFKTPEKHAFKMVDGDPKCNRKWKRIEIMSGCGNWFIMKDDHLHYAGQWAHPSCGARPGDVSCPVGTSNPPISEDITMQQDFLDVPPQQNNISGNAADTQAQIDANLIGASPILLPPKENDSCNGMNSSGTIIGGHPDTPVNRIYNPTPYQEQQTGANPFYKQQSECRPYNGPGTPQNNKAALPQTGIQLLSISGHTFVMDDSVLDPQGIPEWERSTQSFDFGCSNVYMGKTYWKSATGHTIEMSDIEDQNNPQQRGEDNYIRLLSACGNMIELNDHSTKPCNTAAGEKRGITMMTTSNHMFQMIDNGNQQSPPCRMEGGIPTPNADNAFIKIRTGYGMEMQFQDDNSQQSTQSQYIQILSPQKDNTDRGPHILRMQEAASGPGQIFLRAGGDFIISTYDFLVEMVGDPDNNPSDKLEIISRDKIVDAKGDYINIANQHLFVSNEVIMLLAGKDCQESNSSSLAPCPAPVIVYANGCLTISDRVYASASQNASVASIFMLSPFCSAQQQSQQSGGAQ